MCSENGTYCSVAAAIWAGPGCKMPDTGIHLHTHLGIMQSHTYCSSQGYHVIIYTCTLTLTWLSTMRCHMVTQILVCVQLSPERCGDRSAGVRIKGIFWGLPYSAGYLAFVAAFGIYSPFNVKFFNKNGASSRHCSLQE